MAMASKVMATLAEILDKPSHKYENMYDYLTDNKLMNQLHWSPKTDLCRFMACILIKSNYRGQIDLLANFF